MKFSPLTVSTAVAYFATNVTKVFGCGEDTNLGFEQGDLSCWTATTTSTSNSISVETSATSSAISSIDPIFGTYAARIPSGCSTNKLSRTFTSPISGVAKWDGGDFLPYDDNGLIKVVQDGTILFQASIAEYGTYGDSNWLPFQYASPSGNPFTLEVSSTNGKDCSFPSYVLFDLDDFAIDANGPYLVLAGSSTVLEGTSNKLTADIGATWSLDCPTSASASATSTSTSGPSAASVASFGEVSSLSTTLSIPSDVEPELCTLTLEATLGTSTKSSSTQVCFLDCSVISAAMLFYYSYLNSVGLMFCCPPFLGYCGQPIRRICHWRRIHHLS